MELNSETSACRCLEFSMSAVDAIAGLLDDGNLAARIRALRIKFQGKPEGANTICLRLEIRQDGWDEGFHFFANVRLCTGSVVIAK